MDVKLPEDAIDCDGKAIGSRRAMLLGHPAQRARASKLFKEEQQALREKAIQAEKKRQQQVLREKAKQNKKTGDRWKPLTAKKIKEMRVCLSV